MGRGGQLHVLRHLQQQGLRPLTRPRCPSPGGQPGLLSSSSLPLNYRFFSTASPSPDFSNLPGARTPRKTASRPTPVLEITPKQASEAFQHCLNLVKTRDVDNYLSILTMPKKAHPELFALHALNVELAVVRNKIETRGNKDTTGMYRLQFWKDALSSIYGNSHLPVPRQPVAVALCSFAPNASPALLEPLVTARQQTLGDRPFNTVSEVCEYGAKTTGSMIQLRAEALARSSSVDLSNDVLTQIKEAATDIGGAFGVMNLIRSTLPLFMRGVVLLPLDVLTMNGLTPDKVYNRKQPEDVVHVIRDMVKIAESRLSSGRRVASSLPRAVRPAFAAPACVTDHVIASAKKVNYDVYSPYLQRRSPLLLWSLLFKKITGQC